MTKAEARKAADERGWTLEKDGKVFRLTDAQTGTIVAGDWTNADGGYFGLSLADVAKALAA
jgi:hypothetical protein